MDDKIPSLISQLTSSRQQVDTLEKEVAARARENLLLRQQLQEMTDYAEGLVVTMPADWSLEEQNTALRVTLRMVREDWPGDDYVQRFELPVDRDLSSYVRMVMAENEEQGRIVRTLERRIVELDKKIEAFGVTNKFGDNVVSDKATCVTDNSINMDTETKVVKNVGICSTVSSRAKLRTGKKKTSTSPPCTQLRNEQMSSNSTSSSTSALPLSELTDDQFCDWQIRMLEAGQELSKKDMLTVEDMTSKLNDGVKKSRYAEEEMILQPCQVTMTGLGWGPPPGAVVRHVRGYQGVSMVKVEGDTAIVEFSNVEWAAKFRGEGGTHMVEGFRVEVGEVELNKSEIMSSRREDDVVASSVAKVVKRRGGKGVNAPRKNEE